MLRVKFWLIFALCNPYSQYLSRPLWSGEVASSFKSQLLQHRNRKYNGCVFFLNEFIVFGIFLISKFNFIVRINFNANLAASTSSRHHKKTPAPHSLKGILGVSIEGSGGPRISPCKGLRELWFWRAFLRRSLGGRHPIMLSVLFLPKVFALRAYLVYSFACSHYGTF